MSLRVQSGELRGRFLKARPNSPAVRPILARVRKSLFDILRPRIADTRFLDLFAGVGTVGIEALSNGARTAVLVDQSPTSCRWIETNLEYLGLESRARVFRADVSQDLSVLKGQQFDIIFLGAPYKDEAKRPLALTSPSLKEIQRHKLAAPEALVIAQHHEFEKVLPPEGWTVLREKVYGDTTLTFLSPNNS